MAVMRTSGSVIVGGDKLANEEQQGELILFRCRSIGFISWTYSHIPHSQPQRQVSLLFLFRHTIVTASRNFLIFSVIWEALSLFSR